MDPATREQYDQSFVYCYNQNNKPSIQNSKTLAHIRIPGDFNTIYPIFTVRVSPFIRGSIKLEPVLISSSSAFRIHDHCIPLWAGGYRCC